MDTTEADRIFLQIDWTDWSRILPATGDSEELSAAIQREFDELVAENTYPKGSRYEAYCYGGLIGYSQSAQISISLSDTESLIRFYIAYSGHGRRAAIAELNAKYGFELEEG